MNKHAYEIVEPDSHVGKGFSLLADTLGRVKGLPMALLTGQEKAHHHLQSYSKEELEAEIAHLKEDPRLKGTLIRLNHSDPVDTIKRLLKSKDTSAVNKIIGTLGAIPYAYGTSSTRMNHYNPTTDTIELYSRMPEIAHHELGHARDLKGSPLTGTAHSIERLALPGLGFVGAGPVSQYAETRANIEAEKGYKGDIKEFRRRLWPGRGTYWTSAIAAAALLHPDVRNAVREFIGNENNSTMLSRAARAGTFLAIPAVGALGGRVAAEARNFLDRKNEKDLSKKAYVEGFFKRASEHGFSEMAAIDLYKKVCLSKEADEQLKGGLGDFKSDKTFNKSELAKGVAHEGEHTKNRSIAKEIAKDHLTERKDYYSALDKSGLE